nr:MAG TPA: Splicing factor SF3a60 binding domain [Caudoviricetes sp.]DAU59362.1 MAG TPA: Splicing factor SF3a60 binding domain [Crassvirales sp.]
MKYNKNKKSNLFDLYYNRIDTINELYDTYQMQNSATKDY